MRHNLKKQHAGHETALLREEADPLRTAEAIRACLKYLDSEARRLGLGLTAHFIGVAEASIPRTPTAGEKARR